MDFQRRLVVGLDYGTTYSGICYSHQGKPHVVKEWPSFVQGHKPASKTPSRIAYPDNDTRSQPLWGYQIPPTMPAISWTKLLLVNEEFAPTGEDLPWAYAVGIGNEPRGMRPIHVVQEYLAQLYRHLGFLLQKKKLSLDSIPLTVAIAVPAAWPEDLRTKFGFAVSGAGFGFGGLPRADVRLWTEPEAALMATLERRVEKGGHVVLHEGDRVIICDCGGGGTVDLASFMITRKNPLEYNELSPSTGEFCGSTAIDRMFYRFLVEKLGETFLQIPRYLIAPGSSLMKWFERIKHKYNGIPRGVVYRTQIYQQGVLDICVEFTDYNLHQWFEPTVRRICSLVRKHVDDACDASNGDEIRAKIFLVGGFAESQYLRREVTSAFTRKGHVSVYTLQNPQEAVLIGAEIWGHNATRPARRTTASSYGIDDSFYRTRGFGMQINWFIPLGQVYGKDTMKTESANLIYEQGQILDRNICIYESKDKHPSCEIGSSGTRMIAQFACNLAGIDLSRCSYRVENGKARYMVPYVVHATLGREDGRIRFQVYCQDMLIGDTHPGGG